MRGITLRHLTHDNRCVSTGHMRWGNQGHGRGDERMKPHIASGRREMVVWIAPRGVRSAGNPYSSPASEHKRRGNSGRRLNSLFLSARRMLRDQWGLRGRQPCKTANIWISHWERPSAGAVGCQPTDSHRLRTSQTGANLCLFSNASNLPLISDRLW